MDAPKANYTETEIKLKIDDVNALISELIASGAELVGKDFQRTVRMDTPNMDLEKKGLFLRVRSGFGEIVTLKVKNKEDKEVFQRDEFETDVKNISVLADIFHMLGFSKRLIMEKYRVNFDYKDVKISIDELPFGFFAEFEGEKDKIFSLVGEFGLDLNSKITVTYWDLFEDYKKANNLEGESIVFNEGYKSQMEVLKA